jgi:hypothetical protein
VPIDHCSKSRNEELRLGQPRREAKRSNDRQRGSNKKSSGVLSLLAALSSPLSIAFPSKSSHTTFLSTMASLRVSSRIARAAFGATKSSSVRTFAVSARQHNASESDREQLKNPPKGNPIVSGRGAPEPPSEEAAHLKDNYSAASYLGTTKRLPEFALNDKVVLVTGAARGLGLVQAEALLEAGATGKSSQYQSQSRSHH